MDKQETIFALATPRGRGGIAVIRISGSQAEKVFSIFGVPLPAPRIVARHHYKYKSEPIDDGVSLWFPAPHSYTGENVAELHLHASPAVLTEIMDILGKAEDFRLAEPGEFTRRAFLNGKMDLTAAEGVADLIDAETPAQRRQALRLMSGEAEKQCAVWREGILRSLALFEAVLDFPDEDLPPHVLADGEKEIRELLEVLKGCLASSPITERIRDGLVIAVLGAPNVGKSTLVNKLSGRDLAIVSLIPGTTRDVLESPINLSGYPVILTDTAGLRESSDPIELEGMRRAQARAETADLKLLLFDAGNPLDSLKAVQRHIEGEYIAIVNKCDLHDPQNAVKLLESEGLNNTILCVSSHNEDDIGSLKNTLSNRLDQRYSHPPLPIITRERHRSLLRHAMASMERSLLALPLELRCEELRLAARSLGKITGMIDTEEVLGEIFQSFCIGK